MSGKNESFQKKDIFLLNIFNLQTFLFWQLSSLFTSHITIHTHASALHNNGLKFYQFIVHIKYHHFPHAILMNELNALRLRKLLSHFENQEEEQTER